MASREECEVEPRTEENKAQTQIGRRLAKPRPVGVPGLAHCFAPVVFQHRAGFCSGPELGCCSMLKRRAAGECGTKKKS